MAKRIIGAMLSALMLLSSFGGYVSAAETADEEKLAVETEAVLAAEGVRFVNGAASANGDGLTPDSPYTSFASAVNDLKDSGGTIVVVGATDFSTPSNTGDLLITSVYDGADYRDDGATLSVNNHKFGYVDNPGKVTFDGLAIVSSAWNNWHLHGHEFEITEDVTVTDTKGVKVSDIQLLALISTGGNYAGNVMPDTHMTPLRVTVSNSNNAVLILGPCEDITIGDAYVTVNGYLPTIAVSNNTWANYDHGQLSIDGDVFITINGTVDTIKARDTETNDFSLEKFDGNISVLISSEGALTNPITDHIKKRANAWFTVRAAEGTTLTHGEDAGIINLELESGEYTTATFTNTTTNTSYAAKIENGKASITLTESGDYTVSLSNAVLYTLTLVNTITDEETELSVAEGDKVNLPALDGTDSIAFDGWATTENAETAEYVAGAEYTVSGDATLYSVWTEYEYPSNVRFVNAATSVVSGDGRSPETPYKTIGQAATALAAGGGTIVIVGDDNGDGVTETTSMEKLNNIGDILITSVYDGVDYRTYGAILQYPSTTELGKVDNPGKVTFDNIEVRTTSGAEWELSGHEAVFTATCNVRTAENGAPNTQIYALSHNGDEDNQNNWPDTYTAPINLTIGDTGHSVIYVGPRESVAVTDVNVTVDGNLGSVSLSTYAYGKWYDDYWYSVDSHFGALTVNGEVKITVNGSLTKVDARQRFISAQNATDYSTINEIKGNLGVIVNHGGSFSTGITDIIKEKTRGIWYSLAGIEGVTLSYGEKATNVNLTTDGDYNLATLTNTTTGNEYSFEIADGTAAITLAESGEYTTALSKVEIYSVEYVNSKGDAPESASGKPGQKTTLPALSNINDYTFLGWSETEGATEADYEGGESYTITETVTLYAVWAETVYPANVRFVNANAATNGNGLKPSSPYIKISAAAADLATSGGTIVVMGKSTDLGLYATGDIVLTSVYNGVDYRENGARLISNGGQIFFGFIANPGTVTMENLVVQCTNYDSWNIFGYGLHVKDSVEIVLPDGSEHTTVQYLLHATSDTQILPDEMPWETKFTVDNDNSGSIIFGPREDIVTGGYDITINGKMGKVAVSNNTYESYYDDAWLETAKKFGQLTVNGDVKITVNGTMGDVRARKHQLTKETYDYGLKTVNGNLGILINDGASFTGSIDDIVKERTTGKVFTVKSIEGVTLSYGENGDTIVATVEEGYDYNYITIKNDGNSVSAIAGEGVCELVIPASGDYTVEAQTKTVYSVSFSTSPFDELCPETVYGESGVQITVVFPALEAPKGYRFKGWAGTADATEADNVGGDELYHNLTADVTYYAVWEEIPTFTVSFHDDNGEEFYSYTDCAGEPLVFPTEKLYQYGKKLLGYAYEGTTEILGSDAVMPSEDKVAVPVWGDIPAGETRLYVNGNSGNDGNVGTSPDTALKTIAKAVELLRADGGYIIVTGGAVALGTSEWNNSGDITLTSVDPASGIDYRGKVSADKLSIVDGAYVPYGYIGFGTTEMSGKITFENLVLVNNADYQFLCFQGHPFEIGKGNSVYYQKDASTALTSSTIHARALGEGGASKTNPEGIVITVNGLNAGSASIYAVGKANNEVPGLNITVDSDYNGNFHIGNDSQGGITTIKGNIFFTFNGSLLTAAKFTDKFTNPVQGNTYAVYNNGASADISAIKYEDGYGTYALRAGEGLTLSHGENGAFIANGDTDGYIKVTDADGKVVSVVEMTNGSATITLEDFGTYTAEYTDVLLRQLILDTTFEDVKVEGGWYEAEGEIELVTDLYKYGYIFGGWTDGTENYTDTYVMPDKNVTLTAIWENAPKHTLKFDANGSSLSMPEDIEEYAGEYVLLEMPEGDDTFIGWSEDKDAYTGFLDYTVSGDKTLYAITAKGPAYIVESHYRGDPNDYTGPRNSFRRYVIDVYLENAVASEGAFKLDTDNGFLYYLGHIPQEGISATVTAQQLSKSSGTPGLQYYVTPSVEFVWTSDTPVDATNGRIKIARIMMYFSSWGMGYNEIEARTADEVVSPFEGYEHTADGDNAYVSVNIYKGVKSDEVKVSGKVSVSDRAHGTAAAYDNAKLYILDSEGDAVFYTPLESANTETTAFDYTAELAPGEYTVRVIKGGYVTRETPITVSEACEIPEIVLVGGDTTDETGKGDGKVNVDDFVRVLKGFAQDFPVQKYLYAIDLNEDGSVNVSDLAIVKASTGKDLGELETVTEVDTKQYKIGDWSYEINDGVAYIAGGSEAAIASALDLIGNRFTVGTSYVGPESFSHKREYTLSEITSSGVSIGEYRIVIREGDSVADTYAKYVRDYISELSGYVLDIVYDTETETANEILIGETSRATSIIDAPEKYETYEQGGKFFVFYGDEQSAEMASLDLCEKILGTESEGYDGNGTVEVVQGARFEGAWSVLSRFGVMSDSHVGVRYNWANYDWLHNAFSTFENVHKDDPLDFIVSLGDNIDDGYATTYAADYATYLEEIKELDICDPVNPIDGRAEGMIPHYELCGNHDPIGGQLDGSGNLKIRFFKNRLWYTENEKGEKVAHIGFFTDYGGYPLYEYKYSGTYASYYSYGKVNDEMVRFVEESIIAANEQGAQHIILYNHFGMSQQVGSPCLPETGLGKIADVCEKYGIKLYFNGHEHDKPYTLRRYNDIYDYDASMTADRHSIVEITTLRAKVTIYNSADGSVYREDIIPLSGRGEAVQTFAQ